MEYIIKRLTLWKFEFATEDDFSAVVGILQNLTNNTRLFANNGFTPNELLNLRGPINPNNVSMTIGPNMKKMFESGEIDIKEYLDGIINSDLPPLVKQSLIKELKDIKFDIDKKGEA